MRRLYFLTTHVRRVLQSLYAQGALLLTSMLLLLCGCYVSPNDEVLIQNEINTIVKEWQQGDTAKIYNEAAPHFRQHQTPADWQRWVQDIHTEWDSLETVKVLEIEQLVPRDPHYYAKTEM